MGEYDPSFYEQRNYPAYLEDYGAWVLAQIALLRDGHLDELDIENLIEEMEGLSGSHFDAFVSAIRIVLLHMLKWDIQTDYRSRSWASSITERRRRIESRLQKSPSYKARIEEAIADAYHRARYDTAKETRLPLKGFPQTCPFSFDEIMTREHRLDDMALDDTEHYDA